MTTSDPSPNPASGGADLQSTVARSADAADLFGSAPALLLELQTAVGELARAATRQTERGRRPFRPDAAWATALGEVAYRAYLLADQTGVPLDQHVQDTAARLLAAARNAPAADPDDAWPLST